MKSTGIVRQLDALGRIVLPSELRRSLNLNTRDALEIYVNGNEIILKKHEPSCIFCGESDGVVWFREKMVCPKCLQALSQL